MKVTLEEHSRAIRALWGAVCWALLVPSPVGAALCPAAQLSQGRHPCRPSSHRPWAFEFCGRRTLVRGPGSARIQVSAFPRLYWSPWPGAGFLPRRMLEQSQVSL